MKQLVSLLLLSVIATLSFQSCGAKRLSERDQKRQKQQQGVDLKRAELQSIAGSYLGNFLSTDGVGHRVRLILEVKDLPENSGSADPILVPKLVGSLRFILGREDLGETIDAPIQTSEYIAIKKQLSLVIRHAQFGELVMSSTVVNNRVSGTWNAASVSRSGSIDANKDLSKGNNEE
jgi:hypothetical protein